MKKLCLAFFFLFTAIAVQAKTEFGKLQGAEYRFDVPTNWNRGLVVYYHGYRADNHGELFDQSKPLQPELAAFTSQGYAVIQSGYSRGGWALEQAVPETEALRQLFIEKYGKPEETFLAGHSMGGMLTVMTLELTPGPYRGGLDLCGATFNTASAMTKAFDSSVIFDSYFPGLLPSPNKVPADYEITKELQTKLMHLLKAKPQAAAALRRALGFHTNEDLAGTILFGRWVIKDIEQRAGGNPFDNRNMIYAGTGNDNALNDSVKRYAADPGALAYLEHFYTLTGKLTRPVLEIHTTYDPLVPPATPADYSLKARIAGAGDNFVVQYVEHDGHCNITPAEIDRGFTELREWVKNGTKPVAGALK